MRVLLANPPGYGGPDYDHHLSTALAQEGAEVELVTTRNRFGATPEPAGYRRLEPFYPLSSRLFRRSRLRFPLKLVEHPLGMAALERRARRADILHLQWLSLPQLDRWLLRRTGPSVFTAHDVLPRRTASRHALWLAIFKRFDRVVTHSESGRERLAELGVERSRLRVIFHPIIRSEPVRSDDGRTLLCFGLIRAYKGYDDAIAAARRVPGARLLIAGDPMEPIERWRREAGELAEWRLGYLGPEEVDRAYGDATLAIFPYQPELDQSGAMLRALGAGVPVVVYDVGGLAEPVRRFGAGRVVAAGDVDGLAAAIAALLDDPVELERARAGARAAREALTWEEAAAVHMELYRELLEERRP